MDYNFFEGSSKKKKDSKIPNWILIVIAAVITVALGGMTAWTILQTNVINTQMNAVKGLLETNQAKIEELAKKEALSNETADTALFFTALDEAVANSRTVNTTVLDYITGEIPEGVLLSSLSISNRDINLQFTANEYSLIPKLQENLRALKVKGTDVYAFTDIEIPSISATSGHIDAVDSTYTFSISMKMNFSSASVATIGATDTLNRMTSDNNDEGGSAQ